MQTGLNQRTLQTIGYESEYLTKTQQMKKLREVTLWSCICHSHPYFMDFFNLV